MHYKAPGQASLKPHRQIKSMKIIIYNVSHQLQNPLNSDKNIAHASKDNVTQPHTWSVNCHIIPAKLKKFTYATLCTTTTSLCRWTL